MKPHQERMAREYIELYEKRERLAIIKRKYYLDELDFELDCPIELLQAQLAIMDVYLDILTYRAKVEGFYEEFMAEYHKLFSKNNHEK